MTGYDLVIVDSVIDMFSFFNLQDSKCMYFVVLLKLHSLIIDEMNKHDQEVNKHVE